MLVKRKCYLMHMFRIFQALLSIIPYVLYQILFNLLLLINHFEISGIFKLFNPELNPSILDLNNLFSYKSDSKMMRFIDSFLNQNISFHFVERFFIIMSQDNFHIIQIKIVDENILFNLKALFLPFIYMTKWYILFWFV